MASPGSRNQQALLQFLLFYRSEHGISPCYEEIRVALGFGGKGQVYELVRRLEDRGLVRRLPGRSRSLEPVLALDELVRRLLENIKAEAPERDRVLVRSQDIANLDLALSGDLPAIGVSQ